MIGSFFRFYVYYQVRRILFEMDVALPQNPNWNVFDNKYNQSAYDRICKEFFVDKNADWRQKHKGLGRIHHWWIWAGNNDDIYDGSVEYDSKTMVFTTEPTNYIKHIDKAAHHQSNTAIWKTFETQLMNPHRGNIDYICPGTKKP